MTYLLVKNSGAVVPRAEIEKELSKAGLGATGSVKKHIMRLRRKFQDDAKHPMWFANVPGIGYRFSGGQGPRQRRSNGHAPANGIRKAA